MLHRITCVFTESAPCCSIFVGCFAGNDCLPVFATSTLKTAMKKVAVKATFEAFKTECATEISSSCPAGSLAVDPTAAVGVEPVAVDVKPPTTDLKPEHHGREDERSVRGPGHRRLHRRESEPSSSGEERGPSRKDLKGINALSTYV
jgi:hypothetical protein